jgi:hypothetical protein
LSSDSFLDGFRNGVSYILREENFMKKDCDFVNNFTEYL